MSPAEILKLLHRRPFQPFRLHLSDGSHFDVKHPEMALVTRTSLAVGVPGKEAEDLAESLDIISWLHIVRLEVLQSAVA
ncbi:MAG TPA: hypothetical protein VGP72_21215 [Planctomycetota bacterium]|jgi:predicted RNA binding protein YcfA (HicA-like mRNA interferase family)